VATMPPMSRIISVSDLPWEERQPGVKRKLLWEDPATQRRAIINRIEPSAQFPRHRHVGDELVFVIEGALSDEFGTITAGNMGYRPHGCIHTLATKHGATALFIITGSTEPATERGHAPPSEIFALHDLPWVERGPGVWGPGVRRKLIWEDKAGERLAFLARFEPGTTLPRHRHVGDELMFVIEGAAADESGVVATGNINYRPNGCVHHVTTQHGATVLAVVWGRTEPV
jgi:anti-sigma factor ChrR (cupin superfamily)